MKVVNDLIYICSEKSIIKINKNTGELIKSQKVFPKNRRSRQFFVDGKFLYCREFCKLYKIDTDSLTVLHEWELGTDLSSDICAIDFDEEKLFAGIRNGPLAVIDKESKNAEYYGVTDSSIWTMVVDEYIYAGNVNGELLVIDKANFEVLHCENVHKKNLKSLIVTKNTIYTAAQDLSLAAIDKETFNTISKIKGCHKKAFYILGIWTDFLITVSPPCGEMKLWNLSDFSLYKTIPKATWNMLIDEDILYMIDTEGISFIQMNKLIKF